MKNNIKKALIRKTTFKDCQARLFPDGRIPILYPAGRVELLQAGLPSRTFDTDDFGYIEIEREEVTFNEDFMWAMDEDKLMAVMVERCNCDGITRRDIMDILSEMERELGYDDDEEFVPVMVEGEHGYAFGLMLMAAADEIRHYELGKTSFFAEEVAAVLNAMNLETENQLYTFGGVRTHLYR